MDEKKVREALDLIYEAGLEGISHVGAANYASREAEANEGMHKALAAAEAAIKEAPQPRFYVGQPVLVKNDGGQDWRSKMLAKKLGAIYQYVCSDDTCWNDCKPDPDAVSLPNWIEHDGGKRKLEAKGSYIIWVGVNDTDVNGSDKFVMLNDYVLRYCIIPLAVWINP